MSRVFSLFFLVLLFTLSTAVYSSDSRSSHFIERQKLICLNEQIDDLLKEPKNQPILVILTDTCIQARNPKIIALSLVPFLG